MEILFGTMTSELNVFDVTKHPSEKGEICEVDVIDEIIEEKFNMSSCSNPLQVCLINFVQDSEIPMWSFMLIY